MIQSDFHVHTSFSGDSDTAPETQIETAIKKGLTTLCLTDHEDMDYPKGCPIDFNLDTDAYYDTALALQHVYADRLDLRIGVELGLQPHLVSKLNAYAACKPWDFIIGSSHLIDGIDPYFPEYWEGKGEREGILHYFEQTLSNAALHDCYDVYGHIDYIIRYAPTTNKNYHYKDYRDVLDEILRTIIAKGKGIECNTGGFKYGLGHPNPEETLLARYFELGGEILTIGSDAHTPEYIAYAFEKLPALLRACGAKYYTIFKNRKPEMIPLN